MQLIRGRRRFSIARRPAADRDPRLIGATRFARKGDDID